MPDAFIPRLIDLHMNGRFPLDSWELKVNYSQPGVSTTKDGDAVVLHFESVKPCLSLEKGVDVDAAKLPYLAWHSKVTQVPTSAAAQG